MIIIKSFGPGFSKGGESSLWDDFKICGDEHILDDILELRMKSKKKDVGAIAILNSLKEAV